MNPVWFKYISFFLISVAVLLAVYYAFKRERVLEWILKSFEEKMPDGSWKPSGKSLSAFLCVVAFIAGFFIIIYYDRDHNPPEFYVYTLAALIASFYGLREIGRFVNNKNGSGNYSNGNSGNGNGGAAPSTDPNAQVNTTSQPDQANPDNQQQKF